MRIGLISDIHSNLQALETVLDTMNKLKVDRYVCLGDIVGYGANPKEVVDIIRPLVDFTIMGNHDAAVSNKIEFGYYYDDARNALLWTREQLSEDDLAYLANLEYISYEEGICYTHGEPINPEAFGYLYKPEQAMALVPEFDTLKQVTFVGHSHLRRIYDYTRGNMMELPCENITLRPGHKYAIAIGSVGQPRDNDPRACFAIYDTAESRVEFYRIDYDVDKAAESIMNAGLPAYFANRLYSGS